MKLSQKNYLVKNLKKLIKLIHVIIQSLNQNSLLLIGLILKIKKFLLYLAVQDMDSNSHQF